MREVVIVGASDIFDLALASLPRDRYRIAGYIAPQAIAESIYPDYPHLGDDASFGEERFRSAAFVVAVYDNRRRREMIRELLGLGREVLSLRHPGAVVYPSARLGIGSIVAPQAIVSTQARLGDGVYVNYGAMVGHDVVVGDYSFVSPGARLMGRARIGREVLVGPNAVVSMRTRVGDHAQISANTLVTRDVPDGVLVIAQQKVRFIRPPGSAGAAEGDETG